METTARRSFHPLVSLVLALSFLRSWLIAHIKFITMLQDELVDRLTKRDVHD